MPKIPLSEFGMRKSSMVAGGAYFSVMIISIIVTLYFRLIPLDQMGIRLETLPLGIIVGIMCQLPFFFLTTLNNLRKVKEMSEADKKIRDGLQRHLRMHATFAVFDAPVAETFWSGIVLSSIFTYLKFLGLGLWLSSILSILLGTGLHIISHLGPLRPLFGEGAPLKGVYLIMAANRTAFIITNSIVAPILGHFLFAIYLLAGEHIANRLRQKETHSTP